MWEKQEYEMPSDVLFARPTNRAIKSGMIFAEDIPKVDKKNKHNYLLLKVQFAITVIIFLLVIIIKTLLPIQFAELQNNYKLIIGNPLTLEQEELFINVVDETNLDDKEDEYGEENIEITLPQSVSSQAAQGSVDSSYEKFISTPTSETEYILPIDVVSPLKTGTITSEFGSRISPITGQPEFHTGLDIAAAEGTEILSVGDGIVTEAGFDSISGYYVKVEHDSGFISGYAHLESYSVNNGDVVQAGDIIGIIGSTGASTGTHLHLSFVLDGIRVNPMYAYPNGIFS